MNNNEVKIGILGCEHFVHATSYTAAFQEFEGACVVGIYSENEHLARALARTHQIPTLYSNYQELLEQSDIQAVVVCSPTSTHAPLVIAAAEHKKHILCEKPIATTMTDAWAMVDACEKEEVQFHIAYTSRFYPILQEAKELICAGQIGEVIGIRGGNRGIPPLSQFGFHQEWLLEPKLAGGGALIDHSVHVIDAFRFLLEDEVDQVYAEIGYLIHPELSVEDCAAMSLKFRNGVIASIDPSWSLPAKNPFHYDLYLHIVGSEGTISLDDTRQTLRIVLDTDETRGAYREPFGLSIDVELIKNFVKSILSGVEIPPTASGMDGLRSLEVAIESYTSVRTGKPVQIAE